MATLSDIIREVGELGARSPRITNDIKSWVNRAQRIIASRHNFSWMHSRQSVSILAGATSANLSARFKELAPEKSPVTYSTLTSQFPTPVRIMSRAELEREIPNWPNYTSGAIAFGTPFYAFIEQNDGGVWTFNVPAQYPMGTDATFTISCYLFPADLSLGTDYNGLTNDGQLCQALIDLTKSIAYAAEDETNTRIPAARALAEDAIQKAIGRDVRQRNSGRAVRM